MSRLLACPFCREMFEQDESDRCPDCDIELIPVHRLPQSLEQVEAEAAAWEQDAPEDLPQPWHDLKHGRGALLAIASASLLSFWLAPWVVITAPYDEVLSGQALASGRLGWLWGGAVAWFVSIGLVVSRRTINQLRGVKAILTLFAAMTGAEIGMLLWLSPTGSSLVRFRYEWAWGLYVSLALSALGVVAALRLASPAKSSAAHPTDQPRPRRSATLH